ncbi:MAG TPA: SpoIID/LytB domain-containing protein, partial [Gemmatimonadales bacterium]|nr:SpoIID/LytB domain-containing protein [Gemmatimonadales bacterium]
MSEPLAAAPVVGIILQSSATRPQLSGPVGLTVRVSGSEDRWIAGPGNPLEARLQNGQVSLQIGGRAITGGLLRVSSPDSAGTVLLDGRAYRGTLELSGGGDGIVVVNRLDLEDYLVAVVGAEMGRRTPDESSALEAQAVASRTFALRHLDRDGIRGYDLLADVSSQ